MTATKITPFGRGVHIGYNSPIHTILVKFYFTNEKQIPEGIPEKHRQSDQAVDDRHAMAAELNGRKDLAVVGRVREGRVDSGEHFVDNVHNVHAGCLTRGLSNLSYTLTDCHYYWHAAKGKFVVVLKLTTKADESIVMPISNGTIEQRRALARTCWSWCHGWVNMDGVVTLNFGGRMPDGKAHHAIVVREHQLVAATVAEFVKEEDE